MKQESREEDESKSPVLANNAELVSGIIACLHNGEKFLKSSKLLLKESDFQSCIPITTISIEESLKGIKLFRIFQHDKDLTAKDWEDLKNHKYKLTNVMNEILEKLKKSNPEDLEKAETENGQSKETIPKMDVDKIIQSLQSKTAVYSHFKELREGCFYTGRDKLRDEWMTFDELSKESQEKLAFFMVVEAETTLSILKIAIERHVNRLRKIDQLVEKLPPHIYEEYRTSDKFERDNLELLLKEKVNSIKYGQGLKIMRQFIDQKSFKFLSFSIFRKTILEYLEVISKQDDSQWFPHPLIKAMMMAMSQVKEGKTICALSGDTDVCYEEKPHMMFSFTAKMQSGIYEIVNVTEVIQGFECDEEFIEKIIRTEIILERQPRKNVSTAICIEALSSIGVKSKTIKLEEISEAIRVTKELATLGKLEVDDEIKNQILTIKDKDEWNDFDSNLKTLICSMYGFKKYPGYNVYMTPVDEINKSKIRQIIIMTIGQPHLKTA